MISQPAIQLVALGISKQHSIWNGRNTLPDILNQLYSFLDVEFQNIGNRRFSFHNRLLRPEQ